MPFERPSRYAAALIGLTASLALAAPLVVGIGEAKVTSVREAAGLVLEPASLARTGERGAAGISLRSTAPGES